MKKVLLFVFALLTTVISWAQVPSIEGLTYHEEDGGYYEISSPAHLSAMHKYYDKSDAFAYIMPNLVFKVTQDIDMANSDFYPIASAASYNYFNGTFDGNGHTISNLTVAEGDGDTGLFGQLSSEAIVKNLTMANCDIRYNGQIKYMSTGGIAGRSRGTIENCTVTGIVSNYDNQYNVGGIVGENLNPGKVINCTSVTGRPAVGILYNPANQGSATGCHAYYRINTESAVSLTFSAAPITVAGTSCYNEGTPLNVTVTPNDDTQMLTDEVIFTGTTATRTAYGSYRLTMPASDVNVTASVAPKITVTSTSGGSITPSTYSPAIGGTVTLTIATGMGYTFQSLAVTTSDGQSVPLSGSGNTRTFTMPELPVTVRPVFTPNEYTISGLGSMTYGSVVGPSTARYGDQVTLTAIPIVSYTLQSLTVTTSGGQNVSLDGSGNTRTFTMPASNVTVAATFVGALTTHITAYNCTVTASPDRCGAGETVTLTITPDNGATLQELLVRDSHYNFLSVSGSGNTRTFTMPSTDAYVIVTCSVSGQLAGKGTQEEPYLLYNEADLRLLSTSMSKASYCNNQHFRLEADITMSNTPMPPIGYTNDGLFQGYFDGNGHTISNLHISKGLIIYEGLFGQINKSVSNLTLANCTVTCSDNEIQHVGAIVGNLNGGTLSNCHLIGGSVRVDGPNATDGGGIAGEAGGTIIDCSSSASVSKTVSTSYNCYLGGLVGEMSWGTIKRCTFSGSVSETGTSEGDIYTGGIAGISSSATIANCANTGNVSSTVAGAKNTNLTGGIAGKMDTEYAVTVGCTNSGTVTASGGYKNYVGAIDTFHYIGTLKNNYYFGNCNVKGTSSYINSGDGPQYDVTENQGAVRGYAITKPDVVTLSGIEGYDDVLHPAYAAEGETVSFTITAGDGYVGGTVKYNDGSDHVLTATDGVYSFTMPSKAVTITATVVMDPAHFANTGTNEYTIKTATGWNLFCDALQDNNAYNRFSGKTVKLSNDISVTRAAGSEGHEFMGTFEGNNHTLDVTLDEVSTQGTAPFREINGATIKRLNVTGSVNGTTHAAGLVGFARGNASVTNTIENCKVSANVTVTTPNASGNYHCGGLVGHAVKSTLNISNSIYSGTIVNSNHYAGGLQGWSDGNTLNITNCLFSGNYAGNGLFHPIAVRGRNAAMSGTIDGAYYTFAPTLANANFIVASGVLVYAEPQSFPCKSIPILDVTVYLPVDLTPFGKTDNYMPDGTAQYPYLISDVNSWNYLCDCLDDISTWNSFKGKTVKLADDITVTRMAGSNNSSFKGTFDGGNHRLTLNYDGSSDFVAPFPNVTDSVTFRNLTIGGTVISTGNYAAGLVGHLFGTVTVERCKSEVEVTAGGGSGGFIGLCEHSVSFTNCVSSAVIHCSTGNNSGFVGWSRSSRWTIDFKGCVFNGKLLMSNDSTGSNGGFIGWKGDNKIVNITNCLYASAALDEGEAYADGNSATFSREHAAYAATVTNCYYMKPFGATKGKQARSITVGEDVTVAVSGESTRYNLSGITAYGTGLMRDSVLYAGQDDVMALTLGYTGAGDFTGFTVNAGTLTGIENPYTLTMPDENVVISLATIPVVTGDLNGDGNVNTGDVSALYLALLAGSTDAKYDLNGDGNVNTGDVSALYGIIIGGN